MAGFSKCKSDEKPLIDIINHSNFVFSNHWNQQTFPNAYNLELHLTPDVYTKNYALRDFYSSVIKNRINDSSQLIIDKIRILSDYKKLAIINSDILPVFTEWDEINKNQQLLIDSLQRSTDSLEFQNLGNMARTIMNKISIEIYNPIKHKPNDPTKNVNAGKFKNRIHAYIDTVVPGSENEDLRKLSKSAIDFVESSIDFMSATTHKLNAERHLAEVCVISTISAISIIKLIRQLEPITIPHTSIE